MNVVGDWRWSRMIEERAGEWEKRRGGRRKRRGGERGERGKGCWGEVWVREMGEEFISIITTIYIPSKGIKCYKFV